MGDRESFKLLYLVYRCGIKESHDIKEILTSPSVKKFKYLIHNDINLQSRILAHEIVIHDEIENFKTLLMQLYDKN